MSAKLDTGHESQFAVLENVLPSVAFDGWSLAGLRKAAENSGYDRHVLDAFFPGGLPAILTCFSDWIDHKMLQALESTDPEALRVRDRIRTAVFTRFTIMQNWREAERLAVRYWSRPDRHVSAGKLIWKTADKIWLWAGDKSTDYNYYTKRGLLSGVITSTTLAWLGDESESLHETADFLDRRIDNVLTAGKAMSRIKKLLPFQSRKHAE